METYSNHFHKFSTQNQPYFNLIMLYINSIGCNWELIANFNAKQKNNAFQQEK